jgi:hypothetical protein
LLSLGAEPYDYDVLVVGIGFNWADGNAADRPGSSEPDD